MVVVVVVAAFFGFLFVGRSPHVRENKPTNGSDSCWSRNPFCTENQKCVE